VIELIVDMEDPSKSTPNFPRV